MTAELWQRVKELFAAALQLAPSEREAYLSRECGDNSALRSEVESLLAFADSSTASQPTLSERSTLVAGTRLGEYEVVSLLGSGGFGDAYQALDLRLHREVAIKVLPTAFSRDAAALRRFEREALAAARLNHPHIVTIHSIEHVGDVHFIVMELVEGETLECMIPATGLALEKFLHLAAELTDAVMAAHSKGIIHRDLKPGNIMVDKRGSVKILDFGIAKMTERAALGGSDVPETMTGVVSGTVPYMSPEQLQGTKLDARTDVFSLGAVLYQMITGQRPFRGETQAELISSILRDKPKRVLELRTDLPVSLERILERCLDKNATQRFDSTELHDAIQRLRKEFSSYQHAAQSGDVAHRFSASVNVVPELEGGSIRSIAVLPLENLSGNPEQEYFADGLTEALTTSLAKISALRVVSRTSAMQYKGVRKALCEIARDLGVAGIVEGTVLRSGDQVRISVQLINASSDTHLWAESYDRDLRDILALQSEVARAIAAEIQAKLKPREKEQLARVRRVNPDAYEAYLKGRYYWNKRTLSAVKKGTEYFQQAIEKDPTYAAAYAGLADSAGIAGWWGFAPPAQGCGLAKEAARKSLEIEETAEAHASLGWAIIHYDFDTVSAEKEFQRAIELNPRYPSAHQWYAHLLGYMKRWDESLQEATQALQMDPLSLITSVSYAGCFLYTHQWEHAIEHCRKALEFDPNFVALRWMLANAYEGFEMHEEAIRERRWMVEHSDGAPIFVAELAGSYASRLSIGSRRHTVSDLLGWHLRKLICAWITCAPIRVLELCCAA
jgi:serine/threonine protein kinase